MTTRKKNILIMLVFLFSILLQIADRCKPHTGSWLDFVSILLALAMAAFGARIIYLSVITRQKSKLDEPADYDAKKQGRKRGTILTSIIYGVAGFVFLMWRIIADGYRARSGNQLDFIWQLAPLLALLFWGLFGLFFVIKLDVKPKQQD